MPKRNGSSIAGISLKNIITTSTATPAKESETEEGEETTELVEDTQNEDVESRLEEACERLSAELTGERPRIAIAFSNIDITDNTITFKVANESLKEDIEYNAIELKRRICETAGVRSRIEFRIVIEEDTSFIRPIKVEDRLRFLTEINPGITLFRKALDLDID